MDQPTTTAIDIAILLPPKINDVAIAINKELSEHSNGQLQFDKTHLPHITLLQQYVKTSDLPIISSMLEKIFNAFHPITLQVSNMATDELQDKIPVSYWVIESSAELRDLHNKIVEALTPYTVTDGNQESYYRDPDESVRPSSMNYVANFRHSSSLEHFQPHVTLGIGRPKFSGTFSFLATHIAICHLGNFNTCRRVLYDWVLH